MKELENKNIYSKPPIEFHNAVLSTLNSLPEKSPEKAHKIKSKPLRVLVTATITAAAIAATAVASASVCKMLITPNGKYGLDFTSVKSSTADNATPAITTKYAKINLGYLPENMEIAPYDPHAAPWVLRICYKNDESKALSIYLLKMPEEYKFTDWFVKAYQKFDANGNDAVLIHHDYSEEFDGITDKAALVYFADSNILLKTLNMNSFLDDEETIKIVKNITLSPATEDDGDYTCEILDDTANEEETPTVKEY